MKKLLLLLLALIYPVGALAQTAPSPINPSYSTQTKFKYVNITKQLNAPVILQPVTADTDGSTITFDLSTASWHSVTLGGNRTLAVSNPVVGQQFSIILTQDATGSRTVTWFSGIKWAGGDSPPTLTTTAGQTDVFTFKCYGTGLYYGFVAGQNM